MRHLLSPLLALTFQLAMINVTSGQSSFFSAGGAHTSSLANAGTMYQGIGAIYTNPAGLTTISELAFDVGYDRRYALDELSTISLGAAKQIGKGAIGLQVARFGYAAYSENKVGLSYGRQLFDNLSIGGSFHYLGFNIDQYGSANRFTFDFGLQYKVNDQVSIGSYIFNPANIGLTDDQDIPSRISLGAKYIAGKKATVYLDVSKTINRTTDFRFAVDYLLTEQFSLRAGADITKSSLHFGPAYRFGNGLTILGAYAFDNRLGHTTALSLSWSKPTINKKATERRRK